MWVVCYALLPIASVLLITVFNYTLKKLDALK